MKTKWVATPNARKFIVVFQWAKSLATVLLMGLLLLVTSCDKDDDLEIISKQPPTGNVSPPDNGSPDNNKSIIVYTDIEPDFTSENIKESYDLDLNNDQIIDFTVSSDSSEGWEFVGIASNPIANNGIISVSPWYTYALPLNNGQEIFNLRGYKDGEFYSTGGLLFDCYTDEQNCSYYWEDKVDDYLGLKFIINGQTHYGWAQVKVTSVSHWVILDYAYNATPDKPILAGQRK